MRDKRRTIAADDSDDVWEWLPPSEWRDPIPEGVELKMNPDGESVWFAPVGENNGMHLFIGGGSGRIGQEVKVFRRIAYPSTVRLRLANPAWSDGRVEEEVIHEHTDALDLLIRLRKK